MGLFLVSFAVMLLVVLGMSVGVINGRREISGSCGGMSADGKCRFCKRESSTCEKRQQN